MSAAITLVEVRKRYRDGARRVEAVASVSLEVPAGKLWVIGGPSGSGKTTLLGLMGAMIAPTSGSVALLGEPVTGLRDHHRTAIRRERVGFCFQQLSLIDEMAVLENVLLPLVPRGGARPADTQRAMALLERFGVAELARSPAARLSGGQRQRAAIARALILEPPILLLDEPTAHLDSIAAAQIVDALAELRDGGTTLVAATHDERLYADPRVDRALVMRDGAIV